MGGFELSGLRALVAAVDGASLSAAATTLGVSQPTVTRRVQRLERDLDASLLDRTRAGVSPTAAGARLVAVARACLQDLDEVATEIAGRAVALSGTVRIAASTVPGEHLVPGLVRRFAQRHPGVTVDVTVTDSDEVAARLLAGSCDVGFTGHAAASPRLAHRPVATDEVVVAVPVDHRLAGREQVTIPELLEERLIQRERGSGTQQTFIEALRARGTRLTPPVAPITLGSTQAVLAAVAAGLGIGLVSRLALTHPGRDDLCAVRVQGAPMLRDLYLTYEHARRLPPQVRAFIASVIEQVSVT